MKTIIYQALTRLWGNGKFSAWDSASFEYLRTLGVDCIWYTGVPRHATGKPFVKGDPGSPYAISDWFDVNPYLADDPAERISEFEALVHRTHQAGFKVLIDYIPNHVAPDYQGGIVHHDWCDGDWTDTLKNDWSRPETEAEMLEILKFWASKGVDGFRCDMVELVPAEALRRLISAVRREYPSMIFVAEVYGKEGYRHYLDHVGFDLLYDKSGLYDTLRAVTCSGHTARAITWNWQFLGDMQPRMLNFLENHDEQRLASPQFAGSPQKGYAALAVSLLFNDAPFMLYFGQEVGEDAAEGAEGRTSIFNWSKPEHLAHLYGYIRSGKGLKRPESQVLSRYRKLLGYAKMPVFSSGACWDLGYCNADSEGFDADRHFAFIRYNDSAAYLVVCNFSGDDADMEIKIPAEAGGHFKSSSCRVSVPSFDAAVVKI